MFSTIAKTKYGNCSRCGLTDTDVVKIKKDLFCLSCNRDMKGKQQIARANQRSKARALAYKGNKTWEGALPLPPFEDLGQGRIITTMNSTASLQRWFELRHGEMKGKCQHCGGRTQKGQSNYKWSIAHLFPKEFFHSIATHPLNWIELCFYNKSCHTNFDNKMLDIIDLNCFDEVVNKFVAMYPFIAEKEKKRIPNVLLQYIETEK